MERRTHGGIEEEISLRRAGALLELEVDVTRYVGAQFDSANRPRSTFRKDFPTASPVLLGKGWGGCSKRDESLLPLESQASASIMTHERMLCRATTFAQGSGMLLARLLLVQKYVFIKNTRQGNFRANASSEQPPHAAKK